MIYIDPPYNTRDKDWKYNNDYVDADDAYRHSKWLAFMERRLKLASRLLNTRDSTLIVTIDEKEVHRLGLLVEQVFPAAKTQMITIVTNQRGVARGQEFARVDEYAFVVLIGDAQVVQWSDDMLTTAETLAKQKVEIWSRLMRRGTDSRRQDSPKQFYPIFIDPERKAIVGVGEPLAEEEDRHTVTATPGQVAVWPLRMDGTEGRWTLSHKTLERYAREGTAKVGAYARTRDQWSISYLIRKDLKRIESGELVVRGKDENGVLLIDVADNVERLKLPRTVWHRDAHNAGTYGSELLNRFIPGRKFPFPKSLYAVEDMLRFFVRDKRNALILDFFAGSGTTAHAVMRLNKQDDGERRCVLVTNNEVSADEAAELVEGGLRPGDPEWESVGVCKHITEPRLIAAVTGQTQQGQPVKGDYKFIDPFPMNEGLEQNIRFFDLTYEDANEVRYGFAFDAIAPFLWLRAGSRGRCIMSSDRDYDVAEAYAVLFDIDAASSFLAEVEGAGIRHVFIVSDSEAQCQLIANELPESVEAVRLYEGYVRGVAAAVGGD